MNTRRSSSARAPPTRLHTQPTHTANARTARQQRLRRVTSCDPPPLWVPFSCSAVHALAVVPISHWQRPPRAVQRCLCVVIHPRDASRAAPRYARGALPPRCVSTSPCPLYAGRLTRCLFLKKIKNPRTPHSARCILPPTLCLAAHAVHRILYHKTRRRTARVSPQSLLILQRPSARRALHPQCSSSRTATPAHAGRSRHGACPHPLSQRTPRA